MRIPIGRNIYIHSAAPGADSLMISAHGSGSGCGMFAVPSGVRIRFYGTHGNTLVGALIGEALDGNYLIRETVSGGSCHDYKLGKYQGSHGDERETYAALDGYICEGRARRYDVLTIRNRRYSRQEITLSSVLRQLEASWPPLYDGLLPHLPLDAGRRGRRPSTGVLLDHF